MAETLPRPPLVTEAAGLPDEAFRAARSLSELVERDGFVGWDPYDALASPILRRVARGRRGRQATIQALRRSPVNLRRVLGVPRLSHTKALALLTSAHARLALADDDPRWVRLTGDLAARLKAAALRAGDGPAWGYDFDVQTRWAFYPRGQANAVATAFSIHALLDADRVVDGEKLAELAADAAHHAARTLLVESGGATWFGYYSGATVPVHNASLLIAGACARALEREANEWAAVARGIDWSVARQAADGTWPYGDAPGLEWVDGFHTAFNLEALALALERDERSSWREALDRGTAAYRTRLIEQDGTPRATISERYPIDVHAAATAVTTLSILARHDAALAADATRVLRWTLANLRGRDGHFAFQRHRLWRNAVPYIRWSDGHMLLALATYLCLERDAWHARR
jgi:hypothetical protein